MEVNNEYRYGNVGNVINEWQWVNRFDENGLLLLERFEQGEGFTIPWADVPRLIDILTECLRLRGDDNEES